MSVINATPLLAAAGGDYQISRSVRLRSSASAYFNRTPASAGNRKTWTFSAWVKRGQLGQSHGVLAATTGTPISFGFDSSDKFFITISGVGNGTTTAVFRDPSAWYHVVIAFDTTQGPTADRVSIYINNVKQTLSNTLVALNTDYEINNNTAQQIGTTGVSGSTTYFDGYLTEINFINAAVLTPSFFGETDAITGVWKPKKYAGTYGTNGFYLNFSDNSSNTATTIGKDNSGNGNNWTPNNISVTAGVTYDSMIDVPTLYADGGNGRGNYCVLNRLSVTAGVMQDGNLDFYSNTTAYYGAKGTIELPSTGKYYFEARVSTNGSSNGSGSDYTHLGVVITTANTNNAYDRTTFCTIADNGWVYNFNTLTNAVGAVLVAGDVIAMAIDRDANTYTFYRNGSSVATGTLGITAGASLIPVLYSYGSTYGRMTINFGQRPFAYTPPTGFKALNTQNLPAPTILKGNKYFDATLYTGNSSSQTVTNSGSMQPDLVWIKSRNVGGNNHNLWDSVRGAGKALFSNLTDAEGTDTDMTGFTSSGFSFSGVAYDSNTTGNNLVAWQWKANGSAVTNTSGSITSQVNAGTSQGFSVVTYTGNGSASATVGHGLGVVPAMVITKGRSSALAWMVKHKSLSSNNNLLLNGTSAQTDATTGFGSGGIANLTSSTTFGFLNGASGNCDNSNQNGVTYVAYCFSEVAGFSKFGSYTGNGSADGPFVFCGFRPRFVLIKRTNATSDWFVFDTARNTVNTMSSFLRPNWSDAEATNTNHSIDFLSNGFKSRAVDSGVNASGSTYIFMAFAESPFKNSLAR
jgi:hypothetical protein